MSCPSAKKQICDCRQARNELTNQLMSRTKVLFVMHWLMIFPESDRKTARNQAKNNLKTTV